MASPTQVHAPLGCFRLGPWVPAPNVFFRAGRAAGAHRAKPVSYTHLDVYKRQVLARRVVAALERLSGADQEDAKATADAGRGTCVTSHCLKVKRVGLKDGS